MQASSSAITIARGIAAGQRRRAAEIYYAAFERKLIPTLGEPETAIGILETSMFEQNAYVASQNGVILGLVGFQHAGHKLVNVTLQALIRAHGLFSGLRRALLGVLVSRSAKAGELLLDGIAVHPEVRGRGVGTRLFEAIFTFAEQQGYRQIRLDVVDSNPRARQLYERIGFVPLKTVSMPFMQSWGFTAVTTMIYTRTDEVSRQRMG
jgi:ribosomal protein S18 acetylase RimI-like enzyme